ncbi:MAG: IS4 family transposase [Gammaproteobacteria bacterium]|nr:IS4 family transposase [Gammaproteobacteria bacterium]
MDWVIEELSNLTLGDKRLNKRAQSLLSKLSRKATDSIPAACNSAAETKAAYRFFDNELVTPEKIQDTHFKATLDRMKGCSVVLLPQDTTVLNFSKQHARKDVGPTTKDSSKGMHLHCAIAITPEKVYLEAVSIKQWHREELQKLTKKERQKKNYNTPIKEKESYRWLENYKLANEYAASLPATKIVSIADREGDIYDIYSDANKVFSENGAKAFYLIRAKTNRKVCTEEGAMTDKKIKETLKSEVPLGQLVINVSETKKRKARAAHMTIYSKEICIALPDKMKKDKNYKPIKITAILCTENNPPATGEAIEWLLITNLSVLNFEEACEKIQWYACRWQIEIFFKILKSGCTIEKLQLTDKNFSACLNFYIIIAWRILYVVILGRQSPNVSCECVFSK